MLSELSSKLSSFFEIPITPKSKFKVGDRVVYEEIVYPMEIKQIVPSLKRSDPLLYCQWFDKANQETRMTLLHESKLRPVEMEQSQVI